MQDNKPGRRREAGRLAAIMSRWPAVLLWQVVVLLGCGTMPASAHFGLFRITLTRALIEPHYRFLDVRLTGDASDLRDIIHANVHAPSPLTPLTPEARERAARYVNKHLALTQQGVRLQGQLKSVEFSASDPLAPGVAHYELKLRYPRDPALAVAPLQVQTTLFGYLPFACTVFTLSGAQIVLVSGPSNAPFAPELTIVTPAQTARQFWWLGVMEVFSETHLVFLLALLLACGGLAWWRLLAVLAGFTLACSSAFAVAAWRAPPSVVPWIGSMLALTLIGIGIECWRASHLSWAQRGARRGRALIVCAGAGGLVHGYAAAGAGAVSLPEESSGLCLLAWMGGAVVMLVLLGAAILPVMAFLHRHGVAALADQDSAPRRAMPRVLSRVAGIASYLVLGLVAVHTFANAANPIGLYRRPQPAPGQATAQPLSPGRSGPAPTPLPVHHHSLAAMAKVQAPFTNITFVSSPQQPVAGRPATWTLSAAYREDGEPVTDFALLHARLMHLIVASNDLSWYTHIHPVYQGGGSFKITTRLPHAGDYRFYADYQPQGQTDHEVVLHQFRVAGAPALPSTPRLTPDTLRASWLTRRVVAAPEGRPDDRGGPTYEVALMPMPSRLHAGEPVMLHYAVRDATGHLLNDLQPYMGALGHSVILAADPTTYLHVHPMPGDMASMNMKMSLDQMLSMSPATEKLLPASFRGGPYVMFHTFFPKAGLYKVWAQFQRGGRIITAPFVLQVEEPLPLKQ